MIKYISDEIFQIPCEGSSPRYRSVKKKFIGKKVKIEIETPQGLEKVMGKLTLLTSSFQVLLEDVNLKTISRLQKPNLKFEALGGNGLWGLDVKKEPFYYQGPKNTVRAYFEDPEHRLKKIDFGNNIILLN